MLTITRVCDRCHGDHHGEHDQLFYSGREAQWLCATCRDTIDKLYGSVL